MRTVLDDLGARYDIIVIDAPPLLPVADATTLAPRVDGVLIVGRAKQTRRDELKESIELVRAVSGKVLGVALNAVDIDVSGSDYSYYDAEMRARTRRGPFARR
jgi:Mrp family chromosome partitioning ATPase